MGLQRPFEEEGIKCAVFECDGNKALGPDGFSLAMYQDQWEVIKSDLIKVFNEFHESGIINGVTNETYICLIPKKLNSCRIKDFRPTSLVTSFIQDYCKGVIHKVESSSEGHYFKKSRSFCGR